MSKSHNKETLLDECLKVLQYYLDKTERIMKLYQDTGETQYFFFALKGTKDFIHSREHIDFQFLKKCIDSLIAGQKGRTGNDRLTELRRELEEELKLIKMRYDIN